MIKRLLTTLSLPLLAQPGFAEERRPVVMVEGEAQPLPPSDVITVNRTVAGTLPTNTHAYLPIGMLLKAVDSASQIDYTPGQDLPSVLAVEHLIGGSAINNGRTSFRVMTAVASSTSPANPYKYYVGFNSYAQSFAAEPGGVLEASTFEAHLKTGAIGWNALFAMEAVNAVEAGASTAINAGLRIGTWPQHVTAGSKIDAGIVHYTDLGGQPFTWGYEWNNYAGGAGAVKTTGGLMHAVGGWETTTGIDLSGITITGNAFVWGGGSRYYLAGSGNAKLNFTQLQAMKLTDQYTVATLPACNAGASGDVFYVTDAKAPAWNATLTGGGSTRVLALCNGAEWTAH